MSNIKDIVSTSPFYEKLRFGNYVKNTNQAIDECLKNKNGVYKVALVTTENDYLFVGKKLKDELTKAGRNVTVFVFERFLSEECVDFCDVVVTLGDTGYTGCVATVLGGKKPLICISTSLAFADAFAFLYADSALKTRPYDFSAYVIDTDLYRGMKRKDFADGYAFSATLCLCKAECVAIKAFGGSVPDEVFSLLDYAYRVLTYINKENVVGVITVSQIYLMKAIYSYPHISEAGIIFAGKILSAISKDSVYECLFSCAGATIKTVEAYISYLGGKEAVSIPSVNDDVGKLAEILHVEPIAIYENLAFLSNERLDVLKEELCLASVKDALSEANNRFGVLKAKYETVYNARHKRNEDNPERTAEAVKLAGLVSEGVLSVAYYDGFTPMIAEIVKNRNKSK